MQLQVRRYGGLRGRVGQAPVCAVSPPISRDTVYVGSNPTGVPNGRRCTAKTTRLMYLNLNQTLSGSSPENFQPSER